MSEMNELNTYLNDFFVFFFLSPLLDISRVQSWTFTVQIRGNFLTSIIIAEYLTIGHVLLDFTGFFSPASSSLTWPTT